MAKYQALLEGLEVSVLMKSETALDNEKFRIDAEFFSKTYLSAYRLIKSKKHVQIKTIMETLTDFSANGSYATIAKNFTLLDAPNYAYMVRSTDLEKNNYRTDVKYITKHAYDFLNKSKIHGGELLINKIGSPGKAYMMPVLNMPVSLGMNLFLLRLSKKQILNEKFVWIFLNTNIGQKTIQRKVNGTVPLTIDKEAIKSLYIPYFGIDFITKIEDLTLISEEQNRISTLIYTQAETLLLETLGLKDFKPSTEAVNIKSFKDSFGTSGRLDAEYYQPKYEELIAKIKSQPFEYLKNLVNISKSIEPGSEAYQETGIPFVRVSNLSKFGLSQPDIHLDKEDFSFMMTPKNNTILLSKDGSVGIAYKVSEDLNVVTSGAILHLTMKVASMFPDYLTLVLNSKITQMQAERDAGGSIIQHWKPSEISQVIIPIVEINAQQQIAALIQESFKLKAESERLLELAKRAVEMAIEHDETVAIDFINEQIKEQA